MAGNPMAAFLDSFARVAGADDGGMSPLAQAKTREQMKSYQSQRETDEARRDYYKAQTENERLKVQQERNKMALEDFAGYEMIAQDKGIVGAMLDPVGKQRLINAVNRKAQPGGPKLAGFDVMNRDNAESWGQTPELYDQILAGKNPNGRAEDDDAVVVPLYETANGPQPLDIDGDGQVESWSAKQAHAFVRGQFMGSDEIAGSLDSMYTGQPGSGVRLGGSGGGAAPQQPQPSRQPQQAPQEEQPRLALGPNERTAADERFKDAWGEYPKRDGSGPTIEVNKGQRQKGVTQLGKEGEKASRNVPLQEGESDETAIGVPNDRITEISLRSARRVAKGQGISPKQAKELADDPSQLPEPSARATVAAGAQTLSGLEQGPSGFQVTGGKRPTHKQLTNAAILMRAGVIDKDALVRYADTGELSKDGVTLIQQGMQGAVSRANNAADNARSLQQTAMEQQGAFARNAYSEQQQNQRKFMDLRADGKLDSEGNVIEDPVTYDESSQFNTKAATDYFRANGADEEEAQQKGEQVGAKLTRLYRNSESLRNSTGWDASRNVDAMAMLQEESEKLSNWDNPIDAGAGIADAIKNSIFGAPGGGVDLTTSPLALKLAAEGSDLVKTQEGGMFGADSPAKIYSTLIEPMQAAAREVGAEELLKRSDQMQIDVHDIVSSELEDEAQARGLTGNERKALMNDETLIKELVRDATVEYINASRAVSQ